MANKMFINFFLSVVLSQQVEKYKEVFKVACQQALKIDQALSQYLGEARDLPVEDGQ
jgi:hypothetical protein